MHIASLIYIIVAGLLWGTSGLFVRLLTPYGLSAMQMTFIRGFISVLVLGLYILITNKKLFKIKISDLPFAIASGLCMMLAAVFYYASMQKTSVATSVTLLYMSPIYVMLYAGVFLKEKMTPVKIISIILIVLGCAFASGIIGGMEYNLVGIIFGILSGVCYGSYSIVTKISHNRDTNVVSSSFYSYLSMAFFATLISSPAEVFVIGSKSPLIALTMVGLGICTFALPYFLYSMGMKKIPVSIASSLSVIEPLSATCYTAIFFGEALGTFNILGLVCIVASVLLLSKSN